MQEKQRPIVLFQFSFKTKEFNEMLEEHKEPLHKTFFAKTQFVKWRGYCVSIWQSDSCRDSLRSSSLITGALKTAFDHAYRCPKNTAQVEMCCSLMIS